MMAPDYAHWHGMYEVAERFYHGANSSRPVSWLDHARATMVHAAQDADAVAPVPFNGILDAAGARVVRRGARVTRPSESAARWSDATARVAPASRGDRDEAQAVSQIGWRRWYGCRWHSPAAIVSAPETELAAVSQRSHCPKRMSPGPRHRVATVGRAVAWKSVLRDGKIDRACGATSAQPGQPRLAVHQGISPAGHALYGRDRLQHPMKRNDKRPRVYHRISWDEALDHNCQQRFSEALAQHWPRIGGHVWFRAVGQSMMATPR